MTPLLPFKLTICGLQELADVRPSHVLSILDPEWPVPDEFAQYGAHEKLELRFHDIPDPQPGQVLPTDEHVRALLGFGRDLLAEPKQDAHLLVHCHAGISRSTASMALIMALGRPDASAEAIFAELLRIRDKAWPNLRLIELGDAQLGRGGTLVEAVHDVYRHQIEKRPQLWEFMHQGHRDRELARTVRPVASL